MTVPEFYISRILLLLLIVGSGTAIYGSLQFLVNPLSMPWANLDEPVVIPVESLNPLQTIEQVKAELADELLVLGEKLENSPRALAIYPILDRDTKTIRAVRVYQTVGEDFWYGDRSNRVRLIKEAALSGLPEEFVQATPQTANILPFSRLEPIQGQNPKEGVWFTAVGTAKQGIYGQLYAYFPAKSSLLAMLDWRNPSGKLPEWTTFSTVKSPEPDLVIDQSSEFEPLFLVYRLEATPQSSYPMQFRYLNLHESPAMPRLYNEALVLASGGLWSPALAKLDILKTSQPWEPVIQEQYDLITYHAQITAQQASNNFSDYGKAALSLVINGDWREALANLQGSEFGAKIVLDRLKSNIGLVEKRVDAALAVNPLPEVVLWRGVIILEQQGLVAAEKWLRSRPRFPELDAGLALLRQLDLAPLGIEPKEFIGTVRSLDNLPDDLQIVPPPLLPGQTWYEVDINVVRDGEVGWRNAPFAAIANRAHIAIWKALGMERNNILAVQMPNGDFYSLIAQSLVVTEDGRIKLLATGTEGMTIASGGLVKGGDFFVEPRGRFTTIGLITEGEVLTKIAEGIYNELSSYGRVSVSLGEFTEKLSNWTVEEVNLQTPNSKDLLLKIPQDRIDLGDRSYPIVVIFSRGGNLLFRDMRSGATKRWRGLLPGGEPRQILVETNGYYESLSLQQ